MLGASTSGAGSTPPACDEPQPERAPTPAVRETRPYEHDGLQCRPLKRLEPLAAALFRHCYECHILFIARRIVVVHIEKGWNYFGDSLYCRMRAGSCGTSYLMWPSHVP